MVPHVLNIAHRGARSLAPENSLTAACKALEHGADMWEIDVGVTADGELILFHDDILTRVTNAQTIFPGRAPWLCPTFSLAELKQLDIGSTYIASDPFGQISAGLISHEEQTAMQGEAIPTLREALLFTRDHNWRVNIEIKKIAAPMESFPVTDRALALVEELGMAEQVLLSSFGYSNLQRAKSINPVIPTAALRYHPGEDDALSLVTGLGVDAYHPFFEITNLAEIRLLQENGFAVNVWTVNDSFRMNHYIDGGVNGIITDFPQILSQVLA